MEQTKGNDTAQKIRNLFAINNVLYSEWKTYYDSFIGAMACGALELDYILDYAKVLAKAKVICSEQEESDELNLYQISLKSLIKILDNPNEVLKRRINTSNVYQEYDYIITSKRFKMSQIKR